MTMHPSVAFEVERFLSILDVKARGIVEDIYLVGSAAWDDFRPGRSDIGFVGLTAALPGAAECEALRRAHEAMVEDGLSVFDGIYVTRRELLDGPIRRPTGPNVRSGLFFADGRHKRRPADWQMLRTAARAIRGTGGETLDVWKSPPELDRDALDAAEEIGTALRDRLLEATATNDADELSSLVLGVARLHYTLFTGQVTSKTKAGLYGLIALPGWRAVLDDALDARRVAAAGSGSYPHLRAGVGSFVEAVVTDMRAIATASARGR